MSTPELCPACGTKFEIVYYQRRAADEPPDKVVYCSNCPLDTNRLSFTSGAKLPIVPTKKEYTTKNKSPIEYKSQLSSSLSKQDSKNYFIVKGNAALKCYKTIADKQVEPEPIVATPVTINNGSKSVLSYYYINSCTKDEAHITIESNIVAPFVIYKDIDIYTCTKNKDNYVAKSEKCVTGYEYQLPTIQGCTHTVLRTLHNGQQPYIMVIPEKGTKTQMLSILEYILVEYGTESSIKSIVNSTTLNFLYNHNPKAHDHPSAPNNGKHAYTWKPDGERFWYIKYGSIWLFSRRLLSGRIAGWNMCTSLNTLADIGPILDVEVMIGFDPILIDILVSINGDKMPISRTLDRVLDEFNYIRSTNDVDIPIHVREYYRSDKELLQTKNRLQYPVDGVVGIEDGSMEMIKLKDEKSIELELQENGDLLTSDGHLVANSNLQETEDIGSIVEIRFMKQSNSDTPTIGETFVRTDKTKGNDLKACEAIMNSISDTPDTLARRNVVQWCNSISSRLNQIASKTSGKGRVILDIGAGDGQAVSHYSTDSEVTYLLLEPNARKCKAMARRLQDKERSSIRLFMEPSDIINGLRLLIQKKVKYVVLCATLREILDQKDCIRTLKSCIRCCIASLSISYIVPELQELAIEGLNVIGFGYMYDSVNDRGELLNQYGVIMKYTSYQSSQRHSSDAMVQWGTDKAYIEPAIVLKDFKELFYCKLAKNTIPVITDTNISLLNNVSNIVYIISSDRYII